MADHLILKGGTWHVRLDIPLDVRTHPDFFFKKVLTKSLRTGNRNVAKTASLSILADWKRKIQAARDGQDSPIWKVEAEELRQKVFAAIAKAPSDDLSQPHEIRDVGIIQIALKHGLSEPLRNQLKDIVKGNTNHVTAINEKLITEFQKHQSDFHVIEKTAATQASFVRRYAKFMDENTLQITHESFESFLQSLKLSKQSKQTAIFACRAFWKFLTIKDRRLKDKDNPFADHKIPSMRKEQTKTSYTAFTKEEVEQIFAESMKSGDQMLANTIMIGAYTGCRIEEICQLHKSRVTETSFTVIDAKTRAGNRTIAIPSKLEKLFSELCKATPDGFLIASSGNNKYGKRSDPLSKRFGRLKKKMGFGNEKVFHSIRKTTATMLERSGIPPLTIMSILGHARGTITFDIYAKGPTVEQMKTALDCIEFDFSE
ncbi:tyrosine-type recombinase/integrase [Pseudomonas putida]|uniref:tyrosine-type recombinase/integrase n=1 Tax=Pseudomonas putida TaxID=303 RepID=UPI000281F7B9|nr:tyrosine-type recombinase/integrase [Pseudomonas putida]EMR46730.1 Phage integrase [Pseudomonas putida LS46]